METFKIIDDALEVYYLRFGYSNYRNSDGIGLFLKYIIDEEFNDPDLPIEKELGYDCNPNDCSYLLMNNIIPFPIPYYVEIPNKQKKEAFIYYILEYCYKYGQAPSDQYIESILIPIQMMLHINRSNELNDKDKIKNLIKNLIKNKSQEIVDKTKWGNISIYNKINNQKRMILTIKTREFKNDLNQFISNNNDNNIIPIFIFDDYTGNHIEYVHIIKICESCIGISYKYLAKKNSIIPTSIYLDKEFIKQQHKLIYTDHDCKCLDNFVSYIDYLRIFDPIPNKNRCKKLKKFMKKSIKYITKTNKKIIKSNNNTNDSQIGSYEYIIYDKDDDDEGDEDDEFDEHTQIEYYKNQCNKLEKLVDNVIECVEKIESNPIYITIKMLQKWVIPFKMR